MGIFSEKEEVKSNHWTRERTARSDREKRVKARRKALTIPYWDVRKPTIFFVKSERKGWKGPYRCGAEKKG